MVIYLSLFIFIYINLWIILKVEARRQSIRSIAGDAAAVHNSQCCCGGGGALVGGLVRQASCPQFQDVYTLGEFLGAGSMSVVRRCLKRRPTSVSEVCAEVRWPDLCSEVRHSH